MQGIDRCNGLSRRPRGQSAAHDADTLILCYHAISSRWPADLAITEAQLSEQLDWLVAHDYRGVTFSDAVLGQRPGRTVAITFDDAYRSVLEHAAPIMASLGLPGTVFVVTALADQNSPLAWPGIDHWTGGEHDAELVAMSWAQLRELEQEGWEIGSHTLTHPRLTRLDDAQLAREVSESRAACATALGHPVAAIAYPYGDVDARVVRAAAAAGYTTGASLPPQLGLRAALDWPRIGIYRPDAEWRFKVKVSPVVRRARRALAPAEREARRSIARRREQSPRTGS